MAREFLNEWDAENLVIERALNMFLDETADCSEKKLDTQPVACWHHKGGKRLYDHLNKNRIDLWGPGEFTPKKNFKRLDVFLKRMHLKEHEKIRIVMHGKIVATAVIVIGKPYTLPCGEGKRPWTSAMDLHSIELVKLPKPASCFHIYRRSHRLDRKK